jgi:phosphopantetheinyl transferase
MQNHELNTKVRKSGKPRFYGQKKLFFNTLSFSPWVVLATWLHVGAPHKIQEK